MNRRDFLKNMMIMAASAPVFASAGYMAVKKLKKPKNLRIVGQAKLGDEVIRNGQVGQIEGLTFYCSHPPLSEESYRQRYIDQFPNIGREMWVDAAADEAAKQMRVKIDEDVLREVMKDAGEILDRQGIPPVAMKARQTGMSAFRTRWLAIPEGWVDALAKHRRKHSWS